MTVIYTLGVDENGADPGRPDSQRHRQLGDLELHTERDPRRTGIRSWRQERVDRGRTELLPTSISAFTGYVDELTATINEYSAWVFAGNDTFTFKNVGFSQGLHLITQLTYGSPA